MLIILTVMIKVMCNGDKIIARVNLLFSVYLVTASKTQYVACFSHLTDCLICLTTCY